MLYQYGTTVSKINSIRLRCYKGHTNNTRTRYTRIKGSYYTRIKGLDIQQCRPNWYKLKRTYPKYGRSGTQPVITFIGLTIVLQQQSLRCSTLQIVKIGIALDSKLLHSFSFKIFRLICIS
jgi:hypothetical protein